MFKMIRAGVAAAVVVGLMPVVASASVLTFDDLPSGNHFFLADYNGFQFGDNQLATNAWFHTDIPDAQYSAVSGSTYVATDAALYPGQQPLQATMPITSATDFVFNGAFFSGYDTVEYKLYLNGSLVYTSAQSATLSPAAIYVSSGYSGLVDSVVVLGTQGYYAMDNFTYNETAAVPEPGTPALLMVGAAFLGIVSRKKRSIE